MDHHHGIDAERTAVEVTYSQDHLDIWVDANHNGIRDEDDVNIYITRSGSIHVESPLFKRKPDMLLQQHIRDLGLALLTNPLLHHSAAEKKLCHMALELVAVAVGDG